MSETPAPSARPEGTTTPPPPAEQSSSKAASKPKRKESTRDTIESVLFAFVLAFLFRTFEAEAFVIPTGSMAPTLYGRHKEADCSQCGYHIVVGASQEVATKTGYLGPNSRLEGAVCPNCGFAEEGLYDSLAFNGDRILVNKYPYEFGEPDRWDVFVFKYPKEPEINYIKRLVGLPGEEIRIRDGNLYLVENAAETVLRKAPDKQRVLQIPVYDDAHAPRALIEKGWPERWASVQPVEDGGVGGWNETTEGWQRDAEERTYSVDRNGSPAWLRYRHFFSPPDVWRRAAQGMPLDPQARLIGDLCGYNTAYWNPLNHEQPSTPDGVDLGPFWVGDLTINFTIDIQEVDARSELVLELCEGASWYRCRINPDTGDATLEEVDTQLNGRVRELASTKTSLIGPGEYDVSFANVDDRLCLWIDNSLIDFGDGADLAIAGATDNPFPTQADLSPVGISAQGLKATVSNLLLERDIYYRVGHPGRHNFQYIYNDLAESLTDPDGWGQVYQRYGSDIGERTIAIAPDHFLAFGDNSPQSNDSRLWELGLETVPRKYLVGKAFWTYWPHGVPFMNDGRGFPITYHKQLVQDPQNRNKMHLETMKDYPRYTAPFYPQYWRMHRIR